MGRGVGNPHGYPDYTWPMIWVLQDAELWPIEQWVARSGEFKVWENYDSVISGWDDTLTLYTVPAGKKLYITSFILGWEHAGRGLLLYTPAVYFGGAFVPEHGTAVEHIIPPVTIAAGKTLYLWLQNDGGVAAEYLYVVRGYEIDV